MCGQDNRNFVCGFARHIAEYHDQLAWVGRDGQLFTYGCLWENARLLGEYLRDQSGLRPGDIVSPSFENHVSHAVLLFAAMRFGYVLCPLPPQMPEFVRKELIEFVMPKTVLTNPLIIDADIGSNGIGLDEQWDVNRPFLLAVTSGSTGRPKAICHSSASLVGSARAFSQLSCFNATTRLYHILPMTYMAGIVNSLLAVFAAGGTVVEGALFNAAEALNFWEYPLLKGVNVLSLVPLIAATLIPTTRSSRVLERIQTQIQHIQSTSAPVPSGLRQSFLKRFGVPLRDCYGITEVGGPVSLQAVADALALNDFSNPGELYDLEIRQHEGLSELWIRSPFVMKGYREGHSLSLPLDARGYFDTGDLATFENGRMAITGRKKDIIIHGGVNVSPRRIEMLLSTVEGVQEVAVLSIAKTILGEQIVAFVESTCNEGKLRSALYACAEIHLLPHEWPDRYVILPALPRLFNGKLDKARLSREYEGL